MSCNYLAAPNLRLIMPSSIRIVRERAETDGDEVLVILRYNNTGSWEGLQNIVP